MKQEAVNLTAAVMGVTLALVYLPPDTELTNADGRRHLRCRTRRSHRTFNARVLEMKLKPVEAERKRREREA